MAGENAPVKVPNGAPLLTFQKQLFEGKFTMQELRLIASGPLYPVLKAVTDCGNKLSSRASNASTPEDATKLAFQNMLCLCEAACPR